MCSPIDPAGCVTQALDDSIEKIAQATSEMVGKLVSGVGTIWVHVGTPQLTGSGGKTLVEPGSAPEATSTALTTVLGYVVWIGLFVAALSVLILGIRLSVALRRGEGGEYVQRLVVVLGSVILISTAGSLVAALAPTGPSRVAGATEFLQAVLWWPMWAVAIAAVIVAGIKMAWENRADPGRDLLRGLVTLIVVAGSGVTIVQLLITASDSWAVWVLNRALDCDVTTAAPCFGSSVTMLIGMSSTNPAVVALGPMLTIVLGFVVAIASIIQILLMIARSGALVVLAGVMIVPAAAANTEWGNAWFRKIIGWTIAFILYKPAAALVYAASFQLTGTNLFSEDGIVSVLTGVMLMILALVALPALMKFVTPLVGAVAGGAAGGMAGGMAAGAVATGASQLAGKLGGGSGSSAPTTSTTAEPSGDEPSGSTQTGADGSSGNSGNSGDSGPSGSDGTSATAAPANDGADGAGSDGAGSDGAAGSRGEAAAADGAGSGTAEGAATASEGASAAGTAGSASGAAGVGAAGGPVGMAVAAGAAKAAEAGQAAGEVAQGAASDTTGEED